MDPSVPVVSLVGKAGSGKTLLAQLPLYSKHLKLENIKKLW